MKVHRESVYTGILRAREIDITQDQLNEIDNPNGRLIQDIVPHLSDSDREFLMTGVTDDEWDCIFREDDY